MLNIILIVTCTMLIGCECQNVPDWYSSVVGLNREVPRDSAQLIQGTQTRTISQGSPPGQDYQRNKGTFLSSYPGTANSLGAQATNNQSPAWYPDNQGWTLNVSAPGGSFRPSPAVSGGQTMSGTLTQSFRPSQGQQQPGMYIENRDPYNRRNGLGYPTEMQKQQRPQTPKSPSSFPAAPETFFLADNQLNLGSQPVFRVSFVDNMSPLLQIFSRYIKTVGPTTPPSGSPPFNVQPSRVPHPQLNSQTRNIALGDQNLSELSPSYPQVTQEPPGTVGGGGQTSGRLEHQTPDSTGTQTRNIALGEQTPSDSKPPPASASKDLHTQTQNIASGDRSNSVGRGADQTGTDHQPPQAESAPQSRDVNPAPVAGGASSDRGDPACGGDCSEQVPADPDKKVETFTTLFDSSVGGRPASPDFLRLSPSLQLLERILVAIATVTQRQ